jgi:NADH-quinone oxidoreductase subunit N
MMAFEVPNFMPAITEIFLFSMTMLVLLVELFRSSQWKDMGYYLTQLTLWGSIAVLLKTYDFHTTITFHGAFILDNVGVVLKLVVYMTASLVLMYSKDFIVSTELPRTEYYVLTLIIVLGMSVLVSAYNFISLYMGLELLSLPLYAMIAFKRDSVSSTEAAMKYFIMGALASGILLYGMSMIYGATGTLEIPAIANYLLLTQKGALSSHFILLLGMVFLISGIMFKLGAVPFHMWVPDVYEGAPASVTLLIASTLKLAAFALMLRLLVNTFQVYQPIWQHALIAIAILSMALGNITAIIQSNFRRMLAYSSIAHMGYLLLGFIAGSSMGYGASLFYMIVYVIMSLGAFGLIVLLSHAGFEIQDIDDLKGLHARNPWLAFLFLILMFSMAGVPPSAGFFAKITVLEALVGAHLVWLAALALLFAIIGAYYYIRVVKTMYFDDPVENAPLVAISHKSQQLAISVNCLMVLMLGLIPTGLLNLCFHVFDLM